MSPQWCPNWDLYAGRFRTWVQAKKSLGTCDFLQVPRIIFHLCHIAETVGGSCLFLHGVHSKETESLR